MPDTTAVGVLKSLPPGVQAVFGPATLPLFENLFFGDMDREITDSDRLVLRAQLRRETQVSNVAVGNDARYYGLEWDHDGNDRPDKAPLLYQHAFYRPAGVTATGIGQAYTHGPQNNALIINTGAPDPRAFRNRGQKGPGFKDALTFTGINWFGDHTICCMRKSPLRCSRRGA